jgi:hypothetical protein
MPDQVTAGASQRVQDGRWQVAAYHWRHLVNSSIGQTHLNTCQPRRLLLFRQHVRVTDSVGATISPQSVQPQLSAWFTSTLTVHSTSTACQQNRGDENVEPDVMDELMRRLLHWPGPINMAPRTGDKDSRFSPAPDQTLSMLQ